MRSYISRSILSSIFLISNIVAFPALSHSDNSTSVQNDTISDPITTVQQHWQKRLAKQAFLNLSEHGQKALLSILEAKHVLISGQTTLALPALSAANAHLTAASQAQESFVSAEKTLYPTPHQAINSKSPVDWIPVSGDIIASTSLTPDKKNRVAIADAQLKLGESQLAAETIKNLKEKVDYIIALAPLSQTQSSVNRAIIFTQGKNNKGAIAALNDIITSLVFVSENVITNVTAQKTRTH